MDAAWGGAVVISSALNITWRGLKRRTPSPAMPTNGSRSRWAPVCFSAGMPIRGEVLSRGDAYMPPKTAGPVADPYTTSVQWSRRFIGLKLFLALAQHGESGYAGMIEHQTRMGEILRESLQSAGWRIVNSTPLPVVCFTRDGLVPRSS